MTEPNPGPESGSAQPVSAPGPVLVTGAFGLVGSAVVRTLAAAGHRVVATDLDLPANREAASRLHGSGIEVRWADLTAPDQVDELVRATAPTAIVHLAALIPPQCYRRRGSARAVNVEATASLVRAAEAAPVRPRFLQASSVAVYGPRNPHRETGLLTADTPMRPSDLYGAHKAEAEELVRASTLEWVILRLGGVLTVEPRLALDRDILFFEAALPADGRIQTVDVRDVASAFEAAVRTSAVREVFLVGGDESHRLRQGDIGAAMAAATGLAGGLPKGRPGNPDDDQAWFATDWMDTTRSQEVLGFQHHSFPGMLDEIRSQAGRKRHLLRLISPLVRAYLTRRSPYRGRPGAFAEPWNAIRVGLGDPDPDRQRH